MVGGAAAQHLLLAAGPHGRGGIALLTPPDDNGILDWQQNGTERIQADRETTARMIGNMKGVPSAQSEGSAPAERVEVNPSSSGEGAAAALTGGLSSSASSVQDSTLIPEERTVEEEGTASANGEWIENAMEILGKSRPRLFWNITDNSFASWKRIPFVYDHRGGASVILHVAMPAAGCSRISCSI
jgi:hypothetical protein